MKKNIDEAFTAFCALHEAFKGNDEELKEQRRLELRAHMRTLNSEEWESYLEVATARSELWESEERIHEKVKEYENGKVSA